MKIPFSPPDITECEIEEVVDTLRSGWITTGPKVKEFERQIASYCGTNKAACLNSQTSAAELVLRLLGIGPGDEVITSAYTYTASCSIICHVGATPILVDTAPGSYEMDYDQLEAAITKRTKVIIPVDIGGILCDYDRIFDIVERKRGLFQPANALQEAFGRIIVSADAAHSLGSVRNGLRSGAIADFSNFSFHAVKNLTTAEGGASTWREIRGISDEEIYRQFMLLSLHGQDKDALAKSTAGGWEYDVVAPLYKCNMTDLMAAIGLAQLRRYDRILTRRRHLIMQYCAGLQSSPLEIMNHFGSNYCSCGHLFMVRLTDKEESSRNKVMEQMSQAGIATNVHYKPLPLLSAYKNLGFHIEEYPNAYRQYHNEMTLPLYTLLTDEQVDYITQTLNQILRG